MMGSVAIGLALAAPAWAGSGDAVASDDGFEPLREAAGCVYTSRPKDHPDGSAMRAVCTWDDVSADQLRQKLGDFDAYEQTIWVVDESEVRKTVSDRQLVYQLQKLWGLNDREVLLWAWSEDLEDGQRFAWTTASEEPLPERKGAIRTPKNEGFWEVRDAPDGKGAVVTHQIAVDAGGVPLPGWLLRWIRTRGFARVMDEVRESSPL
jgi:hypothetical protein